MSYDVINHAIYNMKNFGPNMNELLFIFTIISLVALCADAVDTSTWCQVSTMSQVNISFVNDVFRYCCM